LAASNSKTRGKGTRERYAASRPRIYVGAKAPTYKTWGGRFAPLFYPPRRAGLPPAGAHGKRSCVRFHIL